MGLPASCALPTLASCLPACLPLPLVLQVGVAIEGACGGVAQDIEGGLVPKAGAGPAVAGKAVSLADYDIYIFQTRPQM